VWYTKRLNYQLNLTTMTDSQKSNLPGMLAYRVDDPAADAPEGTKSRWQPIGAAWEHKDGKGYQLILETPAGRVPIQLRRNEPKPEATSDEPYEDPMIINPEDIPF